MAEASMSSSSEEREVGEDAPTVKIASEDPALKVTGLVKWFSSKLGFGFVCRNDTQEDIFIHKSAFVCLKGQENLRSVREGEPVLFDVVKGAKGFQASNVTGLDGNPIRRNNGKSRGARGRRSGGQVNRDRADASASIEKTKKKSLPIVTKVSVGIQVSLGPTPLLGIGRGVSGVRGTGAGARAQTTSVSPRSTGSSKDESTSSQLQQQQGGDKGNSAVIHGERYGRQRRNSDGGLGHYSYRRFFHGRTRRPRHDGYEGFQPGDDEP